MPDLAGALARYGDAPVVVMERGAVTAADLWRRADVLLSAAGPEPTLRVLSEEAADVIAAILAAMSTDRPVLLSPTAVAPAIGGGFEVLLLTSGTSGPPKIAAHDLASLAGRIRPAESGGIWLLTYSATAFAGLQVVLTALLTGGLLVAPAHRSVPDLFRAAVDHRVTHASGTPTFWRAWLLASAGAGVVPPLEQITIGGEAVDQATLDRLARRHPSARITHIYASTEAGALFAVNDRRAGFPAEWIDTGHDGAELRIVDGQLEVRSPRAMRGYRSGDAAPTTADRWLRTGDLVERQADRVVFCGRGDRMANIGGYKVAPERVERVLLEVDGVADVHVYPRANAITGSILVADLLCEPWQDGAAVAAAVEAHAGRMLAKHERPARIAVVDQLQIADSGKKTRA
jgi:acyl-CoA synthetase (AMP-forming)/AMP-acid ligase II